MCVGTYRIDNPLRISAIIERVLCCGKFHCLSLILTGNALICSYVSGEE